MPILQDFINRVDREALGLHAVAVWKDGKQEENFWVEDRPHVLHSLSKSFTSCAVGIAIEEGKISLDTKMAEVFADKCPAEVSENLARVTVRDLLMMAPGQKDACLLSVSRGMLEDPDWVRYYLRQPYPDEPGRFFRYDTGCTYMVSAMLQRLTGETVLDYLTPRLFEPLGIARPVWTTCPLGITLGGAGLYLRLSEIVRFGRLLLDGGIWEGKPIVPQIWIAEATRKQIANEGATADWSSGYGYQFWINHDGSFRGDGAYGQLCVVFPEKNAVVVTLARTNNIPGILNAVFDEIVERM